MSTGQNEKQDSSESYPLLSIEEAQQEILKGITALEPRETALGNALEQVLGESVYADSPIPPYDNSAMDGYALRAADLAGAAPDKPVCLPVTDEVAAGDGKPRCLPPGSTIRIMTGAPLPAGCDTVVPFERTETADTEVLFRTPPRRGENIRRIGEDVEAGTEVLAPGTYLRPQELGMLAALGRDRIRLHPRPKVAVLATGDELLEISEPPAPGKIRNANSYALAAQTERAGGSPLMLGIARDNFPSLRRAFAEGLRRGADLFLTSGGVSEGDFDVIKQFLQQEGEIRFRTVRLRPGKPFAFGRYRGIPLFGLPGNPVASMISFELFARPIIQTLAGLREIPVRRVTARLSEGIKTRKGFRYFLRVTLQQEPGGGYTAALTGRQGSGILLSMVRAQGLAEIPEEIESLPAGAEVSVRLFGGERPS